MSSETHTLNPYPGLRPFKYSDSRFFYGRDNIIQDIALDLIKNKAVYIVGPSGTGKSSLAFAGLIPALQNGIVHTKARRWRTAVFRPSGGPTINLAGAIYDAYHMKAEGMNSGNPVLNQEETGISREDFVGLALGNNPRKFFRAAWKLSRAKSISDSDGDPAENLLIIADQFEELFRLSGTDPEATHSQDNLTRLKRHREDLDHFIKIFMGLRSSGGGRVHCLVTMRTEYLVDCEINTSLHKDVDRYLFMVRKLKTPEIKKIIAQPARQILGRFTDDNAPTVDEDLITTLLEELQKEAESYLGTGRFRLPDQLPLLQHALSQIWENRHVDGDENDISLADYQSICTLKDSENHADNQVTGLSLALSKHLNGIYNTLDEPLQHGAKRIFLSLVDFGQLDKWAVRRRVKLSRLLQETGVSREDFATIHSAFQTGSGDFIYASNAHTIGTENENSIIDISHESLLRHWGRLKGWIQEEARDITDASDYFRRNLLTGHEVEQAKKWKKRKIREGTFSEAWFSRHLTSITYTNPNATPGEARQNINNTIANSVERQTRQKQQEEELALSRVQVAKTKFRVRTYSVSFAGILLSAFLIGQFYSYQATKTATKKHHSSVFALAQNISDRHDAPLLLALEILNDGKKSEMRKEFAEYVYNDLDSKTKEYPQIQTKGRLLVDISSDFPIPEDVFFSHDGNRVIAINFIDGKLNFMGINKGNSSPVFYDTFNVGIEYKFIRAVANDSDEITVLMSKSDTAQEEHSYSIVKLNPLTGDKSNTKVPDSNIGQYYTISDNGRYLIGVTRDSGANIVFDLKTSKFVRETIAVSRGARRIHQDNILPEHRFLNTYFNQPGVERVAVFGNPDSSKFLIFTVFDWKKDKYKFSLTDATGKILWEDNFNKPIYDFNISESFEHLSVMTRNKALWFIGRDNGEFEEWHANNVIKRRIKKPEMKGYDGFPKKETVELKDMRFVADTKEFFGITKEGNIYFSERNEVVEYNDSKVIFASPNGAEVIIIDNDAIWLTGSNKPSVDYRYAQLDQGLKALEGGAQDPGLKSLAEGFVLRCFSPKERFDYKLDIDEPTVPKWCKDKFPYKKEQALLPGRRL